MMLICVSGHDPMELFEVIEANQAHKQFAEWIPCKTLQSEEPETVYREDFSFTMDVSEPKLCVAYKMKGITDPYERLKSEWTIRFLLDASFTSLNPQYQQ